MENTTSDTSNNNNNNNNNEELGALWKRTARSDGQTYLAGHVKGGELGLGEETVKVVVFSNKNKTNKEKHENMKRNKLPTKQKFISQITQILS